MSEIPDRVDKAEINEPSFVGEQRPQNQTGKLQKLLQMMHISKPQTPAIEVKPPIAEDSEGRAKINREQIKAGNTQQDPTQA